MNTQTASLKKGTLFILEGLMILSFLMVLCAFLIPTTEMAVNVIFGSIIIANISAISLLLVADKKIGVERGLFKEQLTECKAEHA
ncbi:hypothetical protein P7F88_09410 [Vibrio hannami]|uniref:hypothetical protein n=1 Tax=Vibrio hannami TaxID=2717094 RepID=UPI00240F58C8|nr:hypothetical protein [Vibrio hannami]MDG3086311.1 hypothetical protein [Vibrio hannami]